MKIIKSNIYVYHKYAQVEINIPDTIKTDDVLDYLQENEHLYNDKIDEQMFFVDYEFGSGSDDYVGMGDQLAESEWRFDIKDQNYGGHL